MSSVAAVERGRQPSPSCAWCVRPSALAPPPHLPKSHPIIHTARTGPAPAQSRSPGAWLPARAPSRWWRPLLCSALLCVPLGSVDGGSMESRGWMMRILLPPPPVGYPLRCRWTPVIYRSIGSVGRGLRCVSKGPIRRLGRSTDWLIVLLHSGPISRRTTHTYKSALKRAAPQRLLAMPSFISAARLP